LADSTKTQANLPTLGRYTLIKKIAVGGMAEIYLARVSGLGGFEKNVVLKRILPQLAESEEFFKMFLDEARIAATLQHPNIVTVHDAGEVDGEYFIAMEFLDGADVLAVRRILADRGETLPLEQAILIGSSVAAALHYAHEKRDVDGTPLGIVHRDVTPHNVFLTRDGAVKLVDFGIAKAKGRKSKTTYGTLKGKLAYMSPEQCQGEEVDRRSDLYSLGILLYELTTGRRLYRGKSEYVVLKEIVEGTIEPPSSLMSFPSELENIIMKALEKDPDRRFKTARKMQEALEKFARTNQLALSALSLSEFLEPLLTEADRRAKARARKRAANAPASGSVPSVGSSFETMEVQTVEAVEEFGAGIDSLLRGVGIGLDRPDTLGSATQQGKMGDQNR